MSLRKRLARGVSAFLAARLVALAAQVALLLVLTRVFLEPEEYGLLFLAISVFGVALVAARLGIPKSTARYISEYREKDPGQVPHIIRRSIQFNAVTLGVTCLVLVTFASTLAGVFDEPALAPLLALGAVYLVAKTGSTYLTITLQGLGRVPLSAAKSIVSKVGHVAFISLFLALGFGVTGALWGFVAGYVVSVLVGLFFLWRILREYPVSDAMEPGLARRVAEYSLPLTASQSADIVYKRIDTLLIGFFLTPLAVGFYELAKQIARAIQGPAEAVGFAFAPTYGEHKQGGELQLAARVYERAFETVLALYLPAAVGIVLLAEPGIRYVIGADYLGAVPVLQIFSGFVLLQAIEKVTNDSLDYLGRATERAIGTGGTAALNFVLNLLLIPTVGIAGAAAATVASFGVLVTYNVYLINQELPVDMRRLARSTALIAAVSLAMAVVVLALAASIDGLLTLFGVIAAGVATWAVLSVASGVIDVQEVADLV